MSDSLQLALQETLHGDFCFFFRPIAIVRHSRRLGTFDGYFLPCDQEHELTGCSLTAILC